MALNLYQAIYGDVGYSEKKLRNISLDFSVRASKI